MSDPKRKRLSFLSQEPKSKFEIYSAQMKEVFKECLQDGTSKVRKYQLEAVLASELMIQNDQIEREKKLSEGCHVETQPAIIVAPTGSGKSGMIVMLPYVLASRRVLIVVPSIVIRNQIQIAFGGVQTEKSFFEIVGIVENKAELRGIVERPVVIQKPEDIKYSALDNVIIINAQKFARNALLGSAFLKKSELKQKQKSTQYNLAELVHDTQAFFQSFDTLIVDEAHHYPARTWKNIIEAFRSNTDSFKKLIFLTATPYIKTPFKNPRFITDPNGISLEHRKAYEIQYKDIAGISTRTLVFNEMGHEPTNENIYNDMEALFKNCQQRENRYIAKAMVLVKTTKEAKELALYLNKISGTNYAIAVVSEEKNCLERFQTDSIRVAITCNKGIEGYDNDKVVICVIRRKLTSRLLFSQFISRCARINRNCPETDPDKNEGTIISYEIYQQRHLWDERNFIAEEDPIDNDVMP